MPISGNITGKDVRVRIEDSEGSGTFTTIAFASSDTLRINNSEVDALTKDSGRWRDVFPTGSIASMSVDSQWVFDNTTEQKRVRDLAASADPSANFQLVDGSGERFSGRYQISSYEVSGEAEGFPQASVSLVSNGVVTLEADA